MVLCSSNLTSGFIDLATFDELEKYLYGGHDAIAYFVRETRKSTWFSQVPVVLTRGTGQPGFGDEWSVSISRAGDYLLQTWLRLTIPNIELKGSANGVGQNRVTLRWTQNLMHNLIRECCITFNDLVAARFDNFHLDFWAAFTTPAGKQTGYSNMIGNFDALIQGVSTGPGPAAPDATLQGATLNLPLPFFYSRDSGVALPTAALPYNEMRISFNFRRWEELLMLVQDGVNTTEQRSVPVPLIDISAAPEISNCMVWANYAIVSNDERKRMACAPRDMLIEQVQTAPKQTFSPVSNLTPQYDMRFSHAVKVLFFSVRNATYRGEWSVYTSSSPFTDAVGSTNFLPAGSADPILQTSLIYENTNRLAQMGSDFFSLINPYYTAPVIPETTGYHQYSYSLDYMCLDPMGSTNYGKLTNVSITPEASNAALLAAEGGGNNGADYNQKFDFHVTAINNNVIRISGGALGFPVL
tara:strand:- start:1758 stop:3164 length:1407 start_codon:yes stop_codon:yes gene_type:complete